jgi:hypothetical protein
MCKRVDPTRPAEPHTIGINPQSSCNSGARSLNFIAENVRILPPISESSANFTEAAQQRNIEVGLLIRNPTLAKRITFFFDSLLEQNMLLPVL